MNKTALGSRVLVTAALGLLVVSCTDPQVRKQRYVEKGDAYFAEEKHRDAILAYRNALKIDQRMGEAREKLAAALAADGRTTDAVREYLIAAELLPERADLQVRAASFYLAARDYATTRKYAEAALAIEPGNTTGQIILAHSLAGLKDLPAAIREIEEAIELAPQDSRAYTSLGGLRLAEGDRQQAEVAYRKAVDLDRRSIPARLAFGYFYWLTGNSAAAEEQFEAAIAIEENDLLANRFLTAFYLNNNRPAEAEAPLLRLAAANQTSAMITVADYYVRTGRTAEARPIYERLLEDQDSRTPASVRLAELDFAAGARDAAHARVDEALRAQENNVNLLTVKALFLFEDRRLPEAEAFAARAVQADPNAAAAHFTLGRIQVALRKPDEAIASFSATTRINPRAAAAEVQLANLMLGRGRPDAALRHAETARKFEPQYLPARLGVAAALIGQRQLLKADAEIKSLLASHPQVAAVHALHGSLFVARRDLAGAERAFDRALDLDETNFQALAGRVTVDLQLKRFEDGRARLSRAIADQPDNPQILVLAGRFEGATGDAAAAERHLRAALDVDAGALEAYGLLGRLYLRQKRLDEARTEFEQIASRSSDPTGARTMVGIIYDLQNRPDDAIRTYEAVVSATGRAPVAANNLAWRYAERGEQLDRALELAQTAKSQLPESAEVDDTLGWVYYTKNLPDLAIPPLQRSVKRDPANPVYHLHLGLAYARAGRKEEATRALEQALRISKDFQGADQARSTLADLKG